jgi:hypothetical protein
LIQACDTQTNEHNHGQRDPADDQQRSERQVQAANLEDVAAFGTKFLFVTQYLIAGDFVTAHFVAADDLVAGNDITGDGDIALCIDANTTGDRREVGRRGLIGCGWWLIVGHEKSIRPKRAPA